MIHSLGFQEGFDYHHAESGYAMLTYWIPNEPCTLPASPSHQIGVAGFVINANKQVLKSFIIVGDFLVSNYILFRIKSFNILIYIS